MQLGQNKKIAQESLLQELLDKEGGGPESPDAYYSRRWNPCF